MSYPQPPAKAYASKHSDPNYKGEPCNKELANGPIEERGCTDILCCLLFIACLVGMVIVSVVAFKNGHPNQLVEPYDSDGMLPVLICLLIIRISHRQSMWSR